jgi:hypothetical protein
MADLNSSNEQPVLPSELSARDSTNHLSGSAASDKMPEGNTPATGANASSLKERSSKLLGTHGRSVSLAVFALAALAASFSVVPGWACAAAAAPALVCFTGWRRGLCLTAFFAAIALPAWQPVWSVVVVPLAAIAGGAAGWYWKKSSGLRFVGFLAGLIGYPLLLLLVTQFLIPALQPALYWAYGFLPALVLPLGFLGLTGYTALRLLPKSSNSLLKLIAVGSLLLVEGAVTASLCWLNFSESGMELQMRWSMQPELLTELPYTENDRILPRATGEYYVRDSNNQTGFSTEAPHILLEEGNLWWQSPLHNDRWYGRILGNVPGIVRVDADKTDKQKEDTGDSSFIFGNESWVIKSAFQTRHLLSEPAQSSYYRRADKSWVLLVPYISKKPFWTGVMMPHLAGVMAIEQNGFIHDYSVSQAQKLFPGAVFYPPELGEQYARAYAKWRGGFWKTLVGQSGIMEVSENDSKDPGYNPQPYIINFKGLGLQEVICFEPLGEHSYAMVEALFFDAASGKLRSYVVPDNVSLSGPRRCIEQVRSSDTQTDWSHRRTVEPRLTVSPQGIFFLVTITAKEPGNPQNQPYITSVLINARTLHSQRFQQPEKLREFLAAPAGK